MWPAGCRPGECVFVGGCPFAIEQVDGGKNGTACTDRYDEFGTFCLASEPLMKGSIFHFPPGAEASRPQQNVVLSAIEN